MSSSCAFVILRIQRQARRRRCRPAAAESTATGAGFDPKSRLYILATPLSYRATTPADRWLCVPPFERFALTVRAAARYAESPTQDQATRPHMLDAFSMSDRFKHVARRPRRYSSDLNGASAGHDRCRDRAAMRCSAALASAKDHVLSVELPRRHAGRAGRFRGLASACIRHAPATDARPRSAQAVTTRFTKLKVNASSDVTDRGSSVQRIAACSAVTSRRPRAA